jgi:hypothetical protein
MGWGVQILLFSEIGNLRNFSLYIAKIVFFGHTGLWVFLVDRHI